MVAVPDWFYDGVIETVRLLPLPPNTMFPLGTLFVCEATPVTTSPVAGVPASPTTNGTVREGKCGNVRWAVMSEIVGGVGGGAKHTKVVAIRTLADAMRHQWAGKFPRSII